MSGKNNSTLNLFERPNVYSDEETKELESLKKDLEKVKELFTENKFLNEKYQVLERISEITDDISQTKSGEITTVLSIDYINRGLLSLLLDLKEQALPEAPKDVDSKKLDKKINDLDLSSILDRLSLLRQDLRVASQNINFESTHDLNLNFNTSDSKGSLKIQSNWMDKIEIDHEGNLSVFDGEVRIGPHARIKVDKEKGLFITDGTNKIYLMDIASIERVKEALKSVDLSALAHKEHTHSDLATAGHTHTQYAPGKHDHDKSYAQVKHNHDAAYSVAKHKHDEFAVKNHNHEGAFATEKHDHNKQYSLLSHSHGNLAVKDHNHEGHLAPAQHKHADVYAPVSHSHKENITLGQENKENGIISINSGSPDSKDFPKMAAQVIFKVGVKEFKLWVDKNGKLRFGSEFVKVDTSA
jgi:hypothetical protein